MVRTVEAGALIKFARAIGETNPLYLDESYARTTRFGALIAPPTYVSCFTADVLTGEDRISRDFALQQGLLERFDIVGRGALDLGLEPLRQLGAFAGRPQRDQWIEQARLLAAGDTAGYESRFGKL